MTLALASLCNFRIFLIVIFLSLCMHSSYTAVSIVCSLRSLYLYRIPCMIRREILVLRYRFQYSNVCSSMMFVDSEGRGSAHGTEVINSGMLSGLVNGC